MTLNFMVSLVVLGTLATCSISRAQTTPMPPTASQSEMTDSEERILHKIKAPIPAELIVAKAISPEAITVSDDGNQIVFIAHSETSFQSAPPTKAWLMKKENGTWGEPQPLPWRGMITSVTFANQNKWLMATVSHGTPAGYLKILKYALRDREKVGDLEGFRHRIEIFDAQRPSHKLAELSPEDMGLSKPEMLKHARLSPNGKWLIFYTHGYEDQRGIYIHNLPTKRTTFLGLSDDKHPTWTPDGSKILFHWQTGGNSFTSSENQEERSLIGYYDFEELGNDFRVTRHLMDDLTETFTYHKHPAVYPGTDLLFFHGHDDPESSKSLHVRRLKPGSKVYKISDILSGDTELKSIKHANSALTATGLFFVARKKGAAQEEYRQIQEPTMGEGNGSRQIFIRDIKDIYWISNEAIQLIDSKVKN